MLTSPSGELLPSDILILVLAQLRLVRDIKEARVCRALRDAAPAAERIHRRVCFEHANRVERVAAVPDGRILTATNNNTVKVWREDGASARIIPAHTSAVNAVAVLPCGARFVSVSTDRTAQLWTLDALERTFNVGSSVMCVAALPDGVHFVVGLGVGPDNGEVRLYHVDGTLVHWFTGHTEAVRTVAVTSDGQHIISGSANGSPAGHGVVAVWSVAGSLVSICEGRTDCVWAVAAMPDGQRILSGSRNKAVRVHLLDGTLQNTFELHISTVMALVALPDNQHALSGSIDKTVKLFNVNDGAVLRTFTHHTAQVRSLALLHDGRRFVSGSVDKTARIVEIGPLP
jgi:WD40 repeat protein